MFEKNKCTDFQAFRLFFTAWDVNEYRKIPIEWWFRSILSTAEFVGAWKDTGHLNAAEATRFRGEKKIESSKCYSLFKL